VPKALTAKPLQPKDALAFVRQQGVVLASAKGGAPRLVEAILGEPISGNWWAHPSSRFIYNVLAAITDSVANLEPSSNRRVQSRNTRASQSSA
jgi:hypothetical protein